VAAFFYGIAFYTLRFFKILILSMRLDFLIYWLT